MARVTTAEPADRDDFERRAAAVEGRVKRRGRIVAGHSRRGVRFITRHRGQFGRKPVRVAIGMGGRTVVAGLGAVYLSATYGAKVTRRGYRRAAPPVARARRRVAGVIRAQAVSYGGPTVERIAAGAGQRMASVSTSCHRRTARLRARIRMQRRRVAGRMHVYAERSRHSRRAWLVDMIRAVADATHPSGIAVHCAGCNRRFTTLATARNHLCGAAVAQEEAAVARARSWRPVAGGPRQLRTAPDDLYRSNRGGPMTTTAPQGRRPSRVSSVRLAGQEPTDYLEFLGLLTAQAGQYKAAALDVEDFAERMDVERRMDPRALEPLYLAAQTLVAAGQLFMDSHKKFWTLYQDRLEREAESGRQMRDESEFFKS